MSGLPPVKLEDVVVNGKTVPGRKAIYNPETEEVFAICSDQYKLIKHEECMEQIEEVIARHPEYGNFERKIKLSNEGGRLRVTYRFPEVEVTVGQKDKINPTIEVFNSYDLSWRFQELFGAFRIICTNGLTVGEKLFHHKKRHMPDLDIEKVNKDLEIGMVALSDQAKIWEGWADRVIDIAAAEKAIKKLDLNKKETNLLEEEKEVASGLSIGDWKLFTEHGYADQMAAPMTLWIFYNIFTQFITHRVNMNRRVMLEDRVRKIFTP